MEVFSIEGGVPLCGTVAASGAKNAALPMMAASLLARGPLRLERVPDLLDVATLRRVLHRLGVISTRLSGGELLLETVDRMPIRADYALVRRMRASFCVLGPLLATRGKAVVALPGGCNIGSRPVDLHLAGLAALGADIRLRHGYVIAASRGLTGARVPMSGPNGPTVTGTANVLMAAVLARGVSTLTGAAIEPEIVDLGKLLNAMGAKIEGLGTPTLRVIGVEELGGASHRMIADRIEAVTLLVAGAITGGQVTVTGIEPNHLLRVLATLDAYGADVETGDTQITLTVQRRHRATNITALPYPGVPTDLQSQLMALAALAGGTSVIRDRVFPERFGHVAELNRLGADISRGPAAAVVRGVQQLSGAEVLATDLRASAALVLAGLAATGKTVVHHIAHLDRGYERLDAKLRRLGARIGRLDVGSSKTTPHSGSVRRRTAG